MKDNPENPQVAQIKRKHEYEVAKLSDMVYVLIVKIAKTNDVDLMNIFLDWQNQRNVCNEGFIELTKAMLAERSKRDE